MQHGEPRVSVSRPGEVVANFDGGTITSDRGGLLLREVAEKTGILRQFAECFTDHRAPHLAEHTVLELISTARAARGG